MKAALTPVRWRAKLSLMLIRNPTIDLPMAWLAIICVLSLLMLAARACATARGCARVRLRAKPMWYSGRADYVRAIDRAVSAWMVQSRTPGASLAIVRHGQVIKAAAYGWADLANCLPATTSMRFGIGLISKQITAFRALILVQRGKLSLDDPVSRFFPESGAGKASRCVTS